MTACKPLATAQRRENKRSIARWFVGKFETQISSIDVRAISLISEGPFKLCRSLHRQSIHASFDCRSVGWLVLFDFKGLYGTLRIPKAQPRQLGIFYLRLQLFP